MGTGAQELLNEVDEYLKLYAADLKSVRSGGKPSELLSNEPVFKMVMDLVDRAAKIKAIGSVADKEDGSQNTNRKISNLQDMALSKNDNS